MIKYKESAKFKQKKQRMKRIPQWARNAASQLAKKMALKMIYNFRDGIIKNNFRLEHLTSSTVENKIKKGSPYPYRPLIKSGVLDDPKTYKNMLRLRQLKNGWKVYPSWAKHHESNLKLKDLLDVHEYGRIINTGKAIIEIPPRPAFAKALNRTLKQEKKISGKKLGRALSRLIRENNNNWLKNVELQNQKDLAKLVGADEIGG